MAKATQAPSSYWLIKSEPSVYPYSQLVKEKRTEWTGIRSFEARNNLRAMKPGDLALYYHSNEGKEIVAVARILTKATEDSTAPGEDWASVQVAPLKALARPVTLAELKKKASFKTFQLISRSRLSVTPVGEAHFRAVLELSGTALPGL